MTRREFNKGLKKLRFKRPYRKELIDKAEEMNVPYGDAFLIVAEAYERIME